MTTLYVNDGYADAGYVQTGITVDWPNKRIFVPLTEMILVQSTPIEIYQLDIDEFRLALKALEDDPEGMPWVDTHSHVPPISVGGVDLARVVSIINDYEVEFENGNYAVNLSNANSNIADRAVVNNVSVRSANSAGLPNLDAIQAGSYIGEVTVRADSIYSGSTYPVGTRKFPVNNAQDAVAIAEKFGLSTIRVLGAYTFDTGDDMTGYIISGQNAQTSQFIFNDGADMTGCQITDAYVTGTLDGGAILERCVLQNLNYINGFVFECMLNPGIITLGGSQTAFFLNCFSGVPGTGTPTIDMNGTGNDDVPLAMRAYSGGIKLIDKTGTGAVSLDFISGQAVIDSTCVDGTVVVRGSTKAVDENGNDLHTGTIHGGLELISEAINGAHLHEIYDYLGLDPNVTGGYKLTPQVIAHLVWEETLLAHQTVGTMGSAINDIDQTAGLTEAQNTMLQEIYRMYGLDPTRPLVVTNTSRNAGPEIGQNIVCTDNVTTITRT